MYVCVWTNLCEELHVFVLFLSDQNEVLQVEVHQYLQCMCEENMKECMYVCICMYGPWWSCRRAGKWRALCWRT